MLIDASSPEANAVAPFRIGSSGTEILTDPALLRDGFERVRSIGVTAGFAPPLLDALLGQCRHAAWASNMIGSLGTREEEMPERIGPTIKLMLARPAMLRWVEAVTGCGPLASVTGRVAQTRPGSGQGLGWHSDRGDPLRRLAVTVNLTETPYEGGLFELRTTPAHEILRVHHHREPGSILIFRIDRGLEHRLLPVTSGGPRRVFAGWFMAPEEPSPDPGQA